ncbi:hypothetical protein [Crenothrix sp.]|uniref:hypothetical protein n=1 Tax=Crenothrix sp. TaxID=3100433 RepID=UPI00374CA154
MIKILPDTYMPTVLGLPIRAPQKDQNKLAPNYESTEKPELNTLLPLVNKVDLLKQQPSEDGCIQPLATAYMKKWDC